MTSLPALARMRPWTLLFPFRPLTLPLLFLMAHAASGAVGETPRELHGTGDFNGDGRRDLVIVDKATGACRIGYGQPDGSQLWGAPRASGVEGATGIGIGRLLDTTRDALAVTAPDANRVNVLDASSLAASGQPTNVFLSSIGPERVVAIDIGGAGNTAHDDLFTTSVLNNTNAPHRLTLTRSTGAGFVQVRDTNLAAAIIAADVVRLKTNGPALVGSLARTAAGLAFTAESLATGVPVQLATAGNLAEADAFLFCNFNGSALNQFLFYRGGGSNLAVRPVQEPSPGLYQFGSGASFGFDAALREVVAIPGPGDARLLIVFGNGESAGIYSFNGLGAPVLVESLAPDAGVSFSGAVATGGGHFNLFSGVDGRSTRFQNWTRSGNGYTKGAGGELPRVNPLTTSANVFLFARQPFVHPAPRLLGTLNAADWTSQPAVPVAPGQVTARIEQFRGTAPGLGNPVTRPLGGPPAGAAFALANQIADSVSLLSFSPAIGQEVIEVNISPKPGRHPSGVSVTFSTPVPAPVFYRLGTGENWKLYTGTPIALFEESTISYYALAGGRMSAVRHATFQFDAPPGSLDTDGDGVPDFVELGLGGGDAAVHRKDTDGDGYSDLAEILAGTNGAPYDVTISPATLPRPDELSAFDWIVSPRSPVELPSASGTTLAMAGCRTGSVIRVFDLHGGLQKTVPAGPFFGTTMSFFQDLLADADRRLYTAATEPHFDVDTNLVAGFTTNSDIRLGRELLAVTPIPALSQPLRVNYTYGGGVLGQEASNWVAAARAAQAAVTRPLVWTTMSFESTLAALLVERKAGELLAARGVIDPGQRLTLFPHRPQDAGRFNPPQAALLAIETNRTLANGAPDPMSPAFKLTDLHAAFSLAVTSPPSAAAGKLRELAFDLYRVSGASNNVAPGRFPSPVDALRGFIEDGVLPSGYLAATSLSAAELSSAAAGAAAILAGVAPRPTAHLTLRVMAGSFGAGGCTVLETFSGAPRALVLPDGTPFKFPDAFQLPPGSVVEVDGYTDAPSACGVNALEVLSLALTTLPAVSATDADGDLLSDDWECLFLAFDPNADGDGDGASNLKEFLDGTDPSNAASRKLEGDPAPPEIHLQAAAAGEWALTWEYPEAYAARMKFELMATGALDEGFAVIPGATESLGGGRFRIPIPAGTAPARFHQLRMSLR